jgi:hypothetical protein
MAFDLNCCKKCVPFPCSGFEGIISLEVNVRGSSSWLSGECTQAPGQTVGASGDTYIKGPVVGNISMSAYAFVKGDADIWLGTRCFGQAQGNQSIIQKYDGDSDRYYLIPSKDNSATIVGHIDDSVASMDVSCNTPITSFRSQLMNNATVTSSYCTYVGHNLEYKRAPIAFKFPLLTRAFSFNGRTCFLTTFNLNIDFPNPATVDYGFQFIESC